MRSKKLKIKRRSNVSEKTFRSKAYIKKKTRNKRLAKTKSRILRRVKTTRRNRSQDARRSISKTKNVSVLRRNKTKETRSTSKLSLLKTKSKIRLRGKFSEPAKRVKRNYGYSSEIRIVKSKYFHKRLLLKKSETTLTKANSIKLSKNSSKSKQVMKIFSKKAKQKFKHLGKSKDNLRLMKLQYTYTVNGKRRKSYFSSTVAKIKSEKDVDLQLEDLIQEFEGKIQNYLNSGFSDIRISGLRMHAYEEEK